MESIIRYKSEEHEGFEFTFDAINDSLIMTKTLSGFEAKYFVYDHNISSEELYLNDNENFLVNYHRDCWVEMKEIVTKEDIRNWYQKEKIKAENNYYIFQLSCLSHSGVVLSLNNGFTSDLGGWDTSQVGAVLILKKGVKNKKEAKLQAGNLISNWNEYLSGQVYQVVKETFDKNKKSVNYDIVGGYLGEEHALEGLKDI